MMNIISRENKETIMLGDFNCDYKVPGDHIDLKALIKTYGYSQLIKDYTRITKTSRTCIDLCFTTNKMTASDTLNYQNSLSDHNLIGINRKMNCKRYLSQTVKSRDYSKYNKENLKNELRDIPWEKCLVTADFNQGWNLFKHYILSTLGKSCPIKEKKSVENPAHGLPKKYVNFKMLVTTIKNNMNALIPSFIVITTKDFVIL